MMRRQRTREGSSCAPRLRRQRWLLAGCALVISAGPVLADPPRVWYVDHAALGAETGENWADAFTSLLDAVALAVSGDEVWVAQGTYTPDDATGDRTRSFHLAGGIGLYGGFSGIELARDEADPSAHPTVLSGDLQGDDGPSFANTSDNAHHVVTIDDSSDLVVIDGFIFRGGHASEDALDGRGGALFIRDARVDITRSVFEANQAQAGGAIVVDNASVLVLASTFATNSALCEGGGILAVNESSLHVEACTFSGNTTAATEEGGGGGVMASGGTAAVVASTFTDHFAGGVGGSVFTEEANLVVDGCSFTGSLSFAAGGAVAVTGGTVAAVDTVFDMNTCFPSGSSGGAGMLVRDAESAAFDHLDFRGGFAAYPGGGGGLTLRNVTGPSWILNSTFTQNVAADGGGLRLDDALDVTVTNCAFEDCDAEFTGGALSADGSTARVRFSKFIANRSANAGGAVAVNGGTTLELENVRVIANQAHDLHGGGIYAFGADLAVIHSAVAGNSAGLDGGGIYLGGSGSLAISGSTVYANDAIELGGGIRTASGSTVAANSIFWHNVASGTGERAQLSRGSSATINADYCVIEDYENLIPGEGNIGLDPLFVDPLGPDGIAGTSDDDLQLAPGSPAVDGGATDLVSETHLHALGEGDRRFDDPDAPDGGRGEAPITDIGAHERLADAMALRWQDVKPLRAGVLNRVEISNAPANGRVFFSASLVEGMHEVSRCPGMFVELMGPKVVGWARADGAGVAVLRFDVPETYAYRVLHIQAVDPVACRKSTPIALIPGVAID